MRQKLTFILVLLTLLLGQQGLAISYTVQVVALSDQEASLDLQRRLVAEGYPAYLVRVPTESGVVFRLRVGAFANRDAALDFAKAMQLVDGSVPIPALAEGIPTGLIPLEPELITNYPFIPDITKLEVIPWQDSLALRFQGSFETSPLEAEYRILKGDLAKRSFNAWRALATEDSVDRVFNFGLWPENFSELSEEELEEFQNNLLDTIAGSFSLNSEQLRSYRIFQPGTGLPTLILAERFSLSTAQRQRYAAVGNLLGRNMPPTGPELVWLGQAEPEGFPNETPAAIFEPFSLLGDDPENPRLPEPSQLSLQGNGWTASADGSFTRVQLEEGKSWRAVAGYPLWAFADFLLVYREGQLALYQLSKN